jgi:hypothetical protein
MSQTAFLDRTKYLSSRVSLRLSYLLPRLSGTAGELQIPLNKKTVQICYQIDVPDVRKHMTTVFAIKKMVQEHFSNSCALHEINICMDKVIWIEKIKYSIDENDRTVETIEKVKSFKSVILEDALTLDKICEMYCETNGTADDKVIPLNYSFTYEELDPSLDISYTKLPRSTPLLASSQTITEPTRDLIKYETAHLVLEKLDDETTAVLVSEPSTIKPLPKVSPTRKPTVGNSANLLARPRPKTALPITHTSTHFTENFNRSLKQQFLYKASDAQFQINKTDIGTYYRWNHFLSDKPYIPKRLSIVPSTPKKEVMKSADLLSKKKSMEVLKSKESVNTIEKTASSSSVEEEMPRGYGFGGWGWGIHSFNEVQLGSKCGDTIESDEREYNYAK